MRDFIDAFKEVADSVLEGFPSIVPRWIDEPEKPKLTLMVPKQSEDGFDITLECESYGLYPYAGEWHGAPWDVTWWPIEDFKEVLRVFFRALLTQDSKLVVKTAGGKPYKWILSYPFNGKMVNDETGLFFFNYFAKKDKRVYQNRYKPPNKSFNLDAR